MADKYIVGDLVYFDCFDRALNGTDRHIDLIADLIRNGDKDLYPGPGIHSFDKANPFRIAFEVSIITRYGSYYESILSDYGIGWMLDPAGRHDPTIRPTI